MPGALAPGEILPPASAISGRFQARPEAGERELVPPPLPGTTVAPWGPARCSSCRHLPSPLPLPSPHDSAPTPQASSPFFQLTKLLLPLFRPHRTPFLCFRLTSPHPRGSGPGLCPGQGSPDVRHAAPEAVGLGLSPVTPLLSAWPWAVSLSLV